MNRILRTAAIILLTLVVPLSAFAQQDSTVEWRVTIQNLVGRLADLRADNAEGIRAWRTEAENLRSALSIFAATHSDIQIAVPEALPAAASIDALGPQLDKLNVAVDEVIRQSPTSPFHLGESVSVSVTVSTPTLVSTSISETQVEQHMFTRVTQAFDYMPGVQTQRISQRGEAATMVRGFSTRGQVQFYLDGIPISIPYDGYVDFNRFLTGQIEQLQVDKGYTSPLLGPNALGGAINMVTREPRKKLEFDLKAGAGTGDMMLTSLSAGTRQEHFFLQGSYDRMRTGFIPFSGDFQVTPKYQNLRNTTMTNRQNHSNSFDDKYTGRLGWMPRAGDEYVFSYTDQHGERGSPLYQGPNTAATFRSFWSWPYWDMSGVYFHSATHLGDLSQLKVRAFYSKYRNAIDMWSDDTYSVMNTSNASTSHYNDHNEGFSTEFTHIFARQVVSASFFLKNDVHQETGTYPARSPFPLVNPVLEDAAQLASIGFQDAIRISSRVNATLGFAADHINGQQAQSYDRSGTTLVPFTCTANPTNTSFSGCTLHQWTYNPQASLAFQVTTEGNLFVTFSDRGRFPLLKDTYSAGMGSGLPAIDLRPEKSRNWNVGYSQVLPHRTFVQAQLFRSDLRDAIELANVTDPGYPSAPFCPNSNIVGFCRQTVNIAKELHDGAEFEVRTTPVKSLTIDSSYSYLHRTLTYDFASDPSVSQVNTTLNILPVLPVHKVVGTATIRLPREVLAVVSARYENGLTVQDNTYASSSPLYKPYDVSFTTMDLGALVPIHKQVSIQAGIRNVFDKNYYYTPGFPEIGRNWILNLRWQY